MFKQSGVLVGLVYLSVWSGVNDPLMKWGKSDLIYVCQENADLQRQLENMTALQLEVERLQELLSEKPKDSLKKRSFKTAAIQTDALVAVPAQKTIPVAKSKPPQALSLIQETAGAEEDYSSNMNARKLGAHVQKVTGISGCCELAFKGNIADAHSK